MSESELPRYQLRPATPDDREFQQRLYGTTREEEIRRAGLPPEQAATFVSHQFEAQTKHYTAHHPEAEWWIVEIDGQPAGRLILDWSASDLNVMDIALMPAFRGQGLGTHLMTSLLDRARDQGLTVRLFAYTGERAIGLYRRLGFTAVRVEPVHTELMWRAEP